MNSKRGEGKKASASVRQTSAESSPEEMAAFFERRLDGYEEHQLLAIQGAQEFYPFTAKLLRNCAHLDTAGAKPVCRQPTDAVIVWSLVPLFFYAFFCRSFFCCTVFYPVSV